MTIRMATILALRAAASAISPDRVRDSHHHPPVVRSRRIRQGSACAESPPTRLTRGEARQPRRNCTS